VNKGSDHYKNIYKLIDDKLKKIQECKKKSKSKLTKGSASKNVTDLIEIDLDCLDINDTRDHLEPVNDSL